MRTIRIKAYKFNELSDTAKKHAIEKWYENEDYPWLQEDLTQSLHAILEEKGCTFKNLELLYSLSYSQGDGLCFTGSISKNGKTLNLTHNYRYYFARSTEREYLDEDGEYIDKDPELSEIYFSTCAALEKEGYGILEYRMNHDEFSEHCEINNYEFYADGVML